MNRIFQGLIYPINERNHRRPDIGRFLLLSGLILIYYLSGCSGLDSGRINDLVNLKQQVSDHFISDSRTAVFSIEFKEEGGQWIIKGETDQEEAYEALLDSMERLDVHYNDQVTLLPHPDLQGKTYGIIRVSVANIRAEPRHPAELVTQTLLGTPVNVLKKNGGWFLIQTPDLYLGWVDNDALVLMDKQDFADHLDRPKLIFTGNSGFSKSQPEAEAYPVSDLVAGDMLTFIDRIPGFYKVAYPDGRVAYIKEIDALKYTDWDKRLRDDADTLVQIAKRLMGVPYLWGGTSVKGMDCSGFTKTVYLLNGMILPRDASQQENIGQLVDDKKDYDKLKVGDLLFFGNKANDTTAERVVHVGMWIGDMKFIHASGDVHISSMDPADPDYDEYNDGRYLKTKRIMNTEYSKRIRISENF